MFFQKVVRFSVIPKLFKENKIIFPILYLPLKKLQHFVLVFKANIMFVHNAIYYGLILYEGEISISYNIIVVIEI